MKAHFLQLSSLFLKVQQQHFDSILLGCHSWYCTLSNTSAGILFWISLDPHDSGSSITLMIQCCNPYNCLSLAGNHFNALVNTIREPGDYLYLFYCHRLNCLIPNLSMKLSVGPGSKYSKPANSRLAWTLIEPGNHFLVQTLQAYLLQIGVLIRCPFSIIQTTAIPMLEARQFAPKALSQVLYFTLAERFR